MKTKLIKILLILLVPFISYSQDTKPDYSTAQLDSVIAGTKKIDIPTHFNSNGDNQTLDIDVTNLVNRIKAILPNTDTRDSISFVNDSLKIDVWDKFTNTLLFTYYIDNVINKDEVVTTLSNTLSTGHNIGTYTNESNATTNINESVIGVVNNADGSTTITKEDGSTTTTRPIPKKCDGSNFASNEKTYPVQNLTRQTGFAVTKQDGVDCLGNNDEFYDSALKSYIGGYNQYGNRVYGLASRILNGVDNTIYPNVSWIGNGVHNNITGTGDLYNTILNGYSNLISSSLNSIILSGTSNLIESSPNSIILSGTSGRIINSGTSLCFGGNDTIIGGFLNNCYGDNNKIEYAGRSNIVNGLHNVIKNGSGISLFSTILNGQNIKLEGAENSTVFHGYDIDLYDAWETTVLGGGHLSVTSLLGKGFGIWGFNNVKLDQNKFDYNTFKHPLFAIANGKYDRQSPSYTGNNKSISFIQTRDGFTQINTTFDNSRSLVDAEVLPKSAFEVVSTTSGLIPSSVLTWTELQNIFNETTQTFNAGRVQNVYTTNGTFTYVKKRLAINSTNRPTITGDLWGDGTIQTGKYIPDQEGMIVTAEDTSGNTRSYGLFWVESLSKWQWQPSW